MPAKTDERVDEDDIPALAATAREVPDKPLLTAGEVDEDDFSGVLIEGGRVPGGKRI